MNQMTNYQFFTIDIKFKFQCFTNLKVYLTDYHSYFDHVQHFLYLTKNKMNKHSQREEEE